MKNRRRVRGFVLCVLAVSAALSPAPAAGAPPESEDALRALAPELDELDATLEGLRGRGVDPELLADAAVFAKAVRWLLRFPVEARTGDDVALARRALAIGRARAGELSSAGAPSWTQRRGRVARAYRSRVDGSLQPYAVILPDRSWDGAAPLRLDLVLHGRNDKLHEAGFLVRFEDAGERPPAAAPDRIELHVFGRTNNAYRWAGETDVFEALASVRTRYPIDPRRVVLRGFSMGGAGAWHLGLHHPDRWAAVEAGAGFTETEEYARLPNLPPHQVRALRIYDAAPWALNVREVPFSGYGGEEDKQLQAAVNIHDRLAGEGFAFTRSGPHRAGPFLLLVGEKTGHRFHPEAKRISDAFLDLHAAVPERPVDRVRFVTYTTRYPSCRWVRVEGLARHHDRAEVDAEWIPSLERLVVRTSNVTRLVLSPPGPAREVRIDRSVLELERAADAVRLELGREGWRVDDGAPGTGLRKRPGLQGPIDDAFLDSFICVRPTGTPWNERAGAWAIASLERFRSEWAKWMRGDLRVVDDVEVSEKSAADHHLVLFGDPGSNAAIGRVLDGLPLDWTRAEVALGGGRWPAGDHVPVLIFPNPLNPERYVVLNSGHTFGADAFRGTNAYLFPRLGDWAVLRLGDAEGGGPAGEAVRAGFFDESWRSIDDERVYPGASWRERDPEAAGLDGAALAAAAERAGGRGCVVRDGCLVFSWGDIARRGDVASAAKPVYAHFLFRALETGRIPSLDERVVRYEPRLARLNPELGHPDREITWRHLATQTSCYGLRERPGTAYAYNDWQMALFFDLLFGSAWGASHETADRDVLRPLLADRIGCQDDPTFLGFGPRDRPGRLAISPRDFARFGLLYLRGGVWKGEPLISREHARLATASQLAPDFPRAGNEPAAMLEGQRTIGSRRIPDNQTDHMGSYGFLWWTNGIDRDGKRHWPRAPLDAYGAFGHGGKRAVVVVPSLDLVVSWNDTRIEGRDDEDAVIAAFAGAAR